MTHTDFDTSTGANIARLRQARGLSQQAMAEQLTAHGLPWHQQTQLKIERGVRPLRYAEALAMAQVLEVEVASLSDSEAGDREAEVHRLATAAREAWSSARAAAYTFGEAVERLRRAVESNGDAIGVETSRRAERIIGMNVGRELAEAAGNGRAAVDRGRE